jgi:hypothetical protein
MYVIWHNATKYQIVNVVFLWRNFSNLAINQIWTTNLLIILLYFFCNTLKTKYRNFSDFLLLFFLHLAIENLQNHLIFEF